MWSDAELTDYINEARNRIAQDTKCLRQQLTGVLISTGVEAYNVQTIDPVIGPLIVDVMNINVYWGQRRYPLFYYAWSEFTSKLRAYQNFQQRPIAYTRVGATQIYFGPVPDQNYTSDWDVALNATPLTNNGQAENIPAPFIEPIKFWAAYLAKFQEQAMGEAAIFDKEYMKALMRAARSFQTRIIPNVYA
jgi:hypothetical protein